MLAEAHSNMGLCCFMLGRFKEAREALGEAIDLRSRRHGLESLEASEPREVHASNKPAPRCSVHEQNSLFMLID